MGSSATSPSRGSKRNGSGSSPAPHSVGTTWPGSRSTRPRTAASRSQTSRRGTPASASGAPAARQILEAATPDDLSFGYTRAGPVAVASVPCLALRVTYVGELGWELYCPIDQGLAALSGRALGSGAPARPCRRWLQGDRLAAAGEGLPRLGRRHHARGHAYEAGLGFAVKLDKGEFAVARRFSTPRSPNGGWSGLVLGEPRAVALGSEPVRVEGELVGRVTSGGFGYTVEHSIAYAYVPAPARRAGTRGQVEIFGEWVAGEVTPEPLFDPAGERLRG